MERIPVPTAITATTPATKPGFECESPGLKTHIHEALQTPVCRLPELSRYAKPIKDYGYDSIGALRAASEDGIGEMTVYADIGMKKPHRKLMLMKWRELVSSEAVRYT
jgi:hypothetical protein